MNGINLANEKKRDAEVSYGKAVKGPSVKKILEDGQVHSNVKMLKATLDLSEEALIKKFGDLKTLGQAIIDSDPEIDMETTGKKISHTHKLYLNKDNQIAYRVNMVQVVRNPDGTEKERHDLSKQTSNITGENLVQWSGKKVPKAVAIRKFVFIRAYQIKHVSGLTFDFLYDMAKELHESKSLMMVGSGPKGLNPIIMTSGGTPYRAFLEGRIDGDKYCLLLHLTNIELKGI
ncbi:MAG: hypothetical protein LBU62_07010 [Bacteroidales bacterium]|jgi:hypothetical protein|nr:hypothetical protein [Bacteroidales bacterium]